MNLLFLKLMLLYLIEIGKRLKLFLRYWFHRFCALFWKEEPVGEPVLKRVEEENKYYAETFQEMETKCAILETQKKEVDEKIETYRVLIRGWKKLLRGLDYTIRSSKGDKQMIERAITFLVSAKRTTVLAQKDIEGSRKTIEVYEETMRDLLEVLKNSGLVEIFSTNDMSGLSRVNVPLYHIALLREEVVFLQKFLSTTAPTPKLGSPCTWEELKTQHKETHQA